jgi:DNA-binding transcriptional LysR family regulator
MTIDLNRVAAFVRVVREGSFTSAAKALGLPKSSISRSVAQLEQDLGLRLLHRTTRKLHLTDAGSAYYERVSRAITDIGEATCVAADMQAQLRGNVRITAPVDLGVWALAPIVSRFVRKHPNIHVHVGLTGRLVDMVAEGFDLALRVGPLRDSALVARRIKPLEGGIYASARYIARRGEPKRIEDLASHDCVLFRPMPAWTMLDREGRERTVEVSGPVSVDDFMFAHEAVVAGAGLGLMPAFLCEKETHRGSLVRVLPSWRLKGSMLNVVYPSARFVPQRVVVFRDFLLKELGAIDAASKTSEP